MSRFPSDGHLTSWAGVCPGNHQSGGKRYSGKTNPGNAALRKALVQAAAGAVRAKDNSFRALYERLVRRRGKQRALVAVARKLLVVIYHLLKYQRPYKELGADYFDSHKREQVTNRLVQRLSKLGYYVTLETCQKAPSAA
jgi:transposase